MVLLGYFVFISTHDLRLSLIEHEPPLIVERLTTHLQSEVEHETDAMRLIPEILLRDWFINTIKTTNPIRQAFLQIVNQRGLEGPQENKDPDLVVLGLYPR